MEPVPAELAAANPAALEEEYRAREIYSGLVVEPPLAVRLDGVGWGKRLGASEPRSLVVHRAEARAALQAARELGAEMAYVVSDEVSLFWVERGPPYSGRVEKLDSIAAGLLSSMVSLSLGRSLYYDARVVKLYGRVDAARYIIYRARVGLNNYLTSLYHRLGLGRRGVTPHLGEVIEALRGAGVDPAALPRWALYGSCVVPLRAARSVDGVTVERRRWAIVEGYEACLEALLGERWPQLLGRGAHSL